ncbi:unannotated protein [freshwater metagenome]|jgi:hypothetical protein|uniref:Unannotated protein n=1 Tax=freshwater metagenome TaxID=449393 RepID=A0A6J6H5B2_9ZZZZ|nr:hypothetical protein [Actinomycetota bacterium]
MSSVSTIASSMSINAIGGGLVVLGIVLLVVTLSFWKSAVEDPEVLAPLEVMADRKYARADETRRLAMLNMVRPEGAEPVVHHVAPTMLAREPVSEPERPYRDPFNHADDAVEVVDGPGAVIDPLLNNNQENY